MYEPKEYDLQRLRNSARSGLHRHAVGGLWDEIGPLTFEFMRDGGLMPGMGVLDIGCGSLRVGVHLVDYLDPGQYFGIDVIAELLDAGYNIELPAAGLQWKVPRDHLAQTGTFDFSTLPLSRPLDVAVAQSVFSHLSLNNMRLCLANLADVTRPGSTFFATVFHCRDETSWKGPLRHPAGVTTYPASDPYHYRDADIAHAVAGLPWRFEPPKPWGHPRDQSMVIFTRTGD